MAPVLGGDLPWWAVAVVVWSLLSKARAKTRPAGRETWAPALFAAVFSAVRFHLAENVCGPMAQNVVGHKELSRGRQQAKGGGVWKAAGGPKTSDL